MGNSNRELPPEPGAQGAQDVRSVRPDAGGRTVVHVALLVVQLAFASLAVEGKVAMAPPFGVAPEAMAMARIVGGALVFVVAHIASDGPRVRGVPDMARLVVLSLFGIVINQALFLAGLSQTSPMSATLLVATIPIFAAAIAAFAGREPMVWRTAVGIAMALFGIAVLARFAAPKRGDALVLLNAMSYALYVVFAKGVLRRYGTLTVMAWVFGAGALLFAPIGVTALVHDAPHWSAGAIGLVVYIVLVPTMLAYALNAWALRRAAPTLVTIYVYLQPLVVAVLARVQLGHALDRRTLVAGLIILAGVFVVAAK